MGFHPNWSEIMKWIERSESIFLKKLSRNDCSWADDTGKHQSGFYIPADIARSGYFPKLENTNPAKPHIFDVSYTTFWPATGEIKSSSIKHYSNKGSECHHTGVPKDQFAELTPASLLLSGRLRESECGAYWWFMVIDSASEEAEIIENSFELDADFHFGTFKPEVARRGITDAERLLEEIERAISEGTLENFIITNALPAPDRLAAMAQHEWLARNQLDAMDPYLIPCPGDVVMRVSRDIEFSIFKGYETRLRAAQVAKLLVAGGEAPVRNMVLQFQQLDSIFLSASQTRKSRAGRSFEHHVQRLFQDGRVRHEEQVVLGGRRPDFVLPDIETLNSKGDSIVVSLKTTLRERWKQVGMDRLGGAVFLATVDDRVSEEAIAEMERNQISLLVPESLKLSSETEYLKYDHVITFRQFFDDEIRSKRPKLILPLPAGPRRDLD